MTAGRLLFLIPLVYLVVFFVYPLGSILERSLGGESGYGFDPFRVLLNDSYYLGRIWFTIWQAVVSTLLTLAVGLPAAFLFARYEFPGKTLLKAISTLPFVMPTIVVAMGFTALFGSQGILNSALESLFGLDGPPVRISNSLTIIFMAHAFYNYAIIVRIVSALWSNLDPNLEHSAKVLGAGPFRAFYHVTLPLLLPAIVSASLLAFAFSFTSFGVVLVLGGPEFATLEVAIYELTAKLFRLPLAAALAMVQLGFTYFFLVLYAKFQERSVVRMDLKPRETTAHRAKRWRDKIFVAVMVLFLLAMLSPLIALVVRWITFDGGFRQKVHGIAQFLLLETEPEFKLYVTPVQIDPATGLPLEPEAEKPPQLQFDPVTGELVPAEPAPVRGPLVVAGTAPVLTTQQVSSLARAEAQRRHIGGAWAAGGGLLSCGGMFLGGVLGGNLLGFPGFLIGAGVGAIGASEMMAASVTDVRLPVELEAATPELQETYRQAYESRTRALRRTSIYSGVLGLAACAGIGLLALIMTAF